jgi:hypothetical protein
VGEQVRIKLSRGVDRVEGRGGGGGGGGIVFNVTLERYLKEDTFTSKPSAAQVFRKRGLIYE